MLECVAHGGRLTQYIGGATMPVLKESDLWQWLAVSEERLLLHDGLTRMADHIAVPTGVADISNEDFGLPVLDGKSPEELAEIIRKECSTKTTTYASLMEYRLNALRGLWQAMRELEQKHTSGTSKDAGTSSSSSSRQAASFASRVSLVLIFPIMKSLSKLDPNLSSEAASILLESLRACEPLSLSNEPQDCITGLENLLTSWLSTVQESSDVPIAQVQNAASALVALSVAVGTGSLLLRTVHMLQKLMASYPDLQLLVPGILGKLLREHVTLEESSAISSESHLLCWGYDDGLVQDGKEGTGSRSIAFDGQYVYVTSSSLKSLLKVGTGKQGTVRGMVYVSREMEEPGWVVWLRGRLLQRRETANKEEEGEEEFCTILDSNILERQGVLKLEGGPTEPLLTLHLMSDGMLLYWLYMLRTPETVSHAVTGEKVKQHSVYLQALEIKEEGEELKVAPSGERVLLQRTGLEGEKNSDVVKALVRANPSYASSAISSLLGGSKDDSSGATSAGLSAKVLQGSAAYTTGSSLVLLTAPPTSGGRGGIFGSSSGHTSKPLCISTCFSLQNGKVLSQTDLAPNSQLHCALAKGASMQGMAACYDSRNHCLWTCNNDWIDIWDCAGKVRVAIHHLASRLGKTDITELIPSLQADQGTILVSEAITLMLRHIGIESCRLVPGSEFSMTVVHSLPLTFLEQCCDLLDYSVRKKNWENALAIVITMQAVLPGFLSNQYLNEDSAPLKDRVRSLVWSLLTSAECPDPLRTETKRTVSRNAEALFLKHPDSSNFIDTLLNADSSQPTLLALRDDILLQNAHDLQFCCTLSPHVASISRLLTEAIASDSMSMIQKCFECSASELPRLVAQSPVFTPSLHCAAMLLGVTLRGMVLALQEDRQQLESAQSALLELCEDFNLFNTCQKTLEVLCVSVGSMPAGEEEEGLRQSRLQAVERVTKATVLGTLLLPLLAVVSNPASCTLQMANTLQRKFTSLAQLAAQVCALLYGSSGELLSIKVPAPWATGRLVETIHPVRDNYKFKETVSFPGAKNLYLKVDPRSSSQYDYDKVIVYAGDSTTAPKVAEYGGNTHGFGSRSVLGKGWPKDLVKVEGDMVTFTFEMKSGREHSTPDKAMWGFACTVRPQESAEDTPTGLPFLTDLYLSLVSVCCSLVGSLYGGPQPTPEEAKCRPLMDSELLQRCVWPASEGPPDSLPLDPDLFPPPKPAPHEPLPDVIIQRLRELANKPQPTLRPSTRELLQPELLEEAIVCVCLKQHGVKSALKVLGQSADSPSLETNRSLLEAVFTRVNGLERRLQALAELERNWWHDVEDMVEGKMGPNDAFFFNLLQHESSVKSFELMCCLREVEVNQNDLFTTAKQLQDLMELDVERRKTAGKDASSLDYTPVTRSLVKGVMERAHLLLNVTIALDDDVSTCPKEKGVQDDTLAVTSPTLTYARSVSAPPMTVEISTRRQKSCASHRKKTLLDISASHDKSNLLDQIFQFIGTKPEEAVSCDSFLAAASQQWRRGVCRVRALGYLNQLLTSEYIPLAVEHLLASVGSVLQRGPGIEDIACGGMAQPVRMAFSEVMHAVVELASKQPAACINTIATLCIIPYTKPEEQCLVRSGLVKLLDRLCSLVDSQKPLEVGGEEDDALHRVTSLAWAAFQVLADRCVSWETQDSAVVSSGLAQQVSLLLTNHLSRAMDRLVVSESGASEGLQDALSLLLGLAKSHMGRAILSQPACVSKLLLLLTDQRPSPKLVLIALQLCRIALPLMTVADCSQVIVPPHPSLPPSKNSGLAADIVELLLAKLAEYIVPDASQMVPKQSVSGKLASSETEGHVTRKMEDEFDESGQASVYVFKRENESAAEILQPLISQDSRQFRLSGPRMQELIQMDRALTEHGKAEIVTDSYRACFRRALRWASMGFTLSVGPPSGGTGDPSSSVVDKKKAQAEAAAKKKNLELLKTDPTRPFVSGHVAYSLASEVIGLLHGLLTEPGAAEVWTTAIKEAMLQSLLSIPDLAPKLASYTESVHSCVANGAALPPPGELLQSACIANATFAALGGFKESVRVGMKVQVVGSDIQDSFGTIQSISERRGLANVQFPDDDYCFGPNKTLEVPLSRLLPPQKDTLPLRQLKVKEQLCGAICALLKTNPPSITHAHTGTDANTTSLGLCRLFAELRTRACMCLTHHVKDSSFSALLFSHSPLELLGSQAQECSPGQRVSLVESHCQSLRMLYRDCARPAPPRIEKPRNEPKRIQLDVTRQWPPVTSCCFTHQLTSVAYQGPTAITPTAGSSSAAQDTSSHPKGVVIYANVAIPAQAPSFYWELELCHLGDSSSDASHIAMGYAPSPQKPAEGQPWAYAPDTCLIRSTGRGCQVRGDSLLEWKTFRLNSPLKNGDVVGCGWVKGEEGTKGTVYFTLNGVQLSHEFQDTPVEMIPFLHIQKKAIRVRVNFGDRQFLFAEGHEHRDAADLHEERESVEEVAAIFEVLPFATGASDSEGEGVGEERREGGSVVELSQIGPPTRKLKAPIATVGYNSEASQGYQLVHSFDTMLESGPLMRPGGSSQEEESEEGEGGSSPPEEDLHALLVKAWETKVFPVIQRRFRNDQERRSGLEQIKGALQLGMESIAQETVEFLYEENGGIPKDLRLPTMDDVKAELGKFTISRVRKGSAVVVQRELPYARCGVRTMQKTQSLTGIVLDVDEPNELVQVECYLQNEGALVRFWYPVVYLERPPPGYRKSPTLRGTDAANMLVHRELLRCEASLASMYCRRALLTLQLASTDAVDTSLHHLRMLATNCFAEPFTEGGTTTTSPDLSPSPISCLHTLTLSPLHTFYTNVEQLQHEISATIRVLIGSLEGVAQQLCACLLRTPRDYGATELKISESKEAVDISHPDAAFLVVSCTDEKSSNSQPQSSSYKYPWARVLCYRGGQGKGGNEQLQEVARYPNEIVQSSAHHYCGQTYPSLILPFNRIHVKLGGCSTRPGKLVNILALPADFPLSLAFTHTLSRHAYEMYKNSDSSLDSILQCSKALSVCLEGLSKFVCRLDCPLPLKETMLHQLSEVTWTLCATAPEGFSPYALPTEFLQGMRQELLKQFETESRAFPSGKGSKSKSSFPLAGSIGEGGSGKFSTYFQALLEFVLATMEYQHVFHGEEIPSAPPTPATPTSVATPTFAPSGSTTPTGTSAATPSCATPLAASEQGKKAARRGRARKGIKKEAETDPQKKEEWLYNVRSATTLLRGMVQLSGEQSWSQIHESSVASSLPARPNSRLLVVTGIDSKLGIEDVQKAIRRVCHTHGGLYKDQLYLPVEEVKVREGEAGGKVEDGRGEGEKDVKEMEEGTEVEEGTPKEAQQLSTRGSPAQEEEEEETQQDEPPQEPPELGPKPVGDSPPTHRLLGYAVLELCCSSQVLAVSSALQATPELQMEEGSVLVAAVSDGLTCGEDEIASRVLVEYLRKKLVAEEGLSERAKRTLTDIFRSSLGPKNEEESITVPQVAGRLQLFLSGYVGGKGSVEELLEGVCKQQGGRLVLERFLQWSLEQVEGGGVAAMWQGLFASGYDLHFERCGFTAADSLAQCPSPLQDHALVQYVDSLCRHLALSATSLQPWDITLTEAGLTSQQLAPLQVLSLADVRQRFLQLKHINQEFSLLLSVVDLCSTHPLSLGTLLTQVAPLLFYDVKISFLHAVLNASTRRSLEQPPPEIKMDPLESVAGLASTPLTTQFCQAARQMLSVPSPQLCVPLASGGDPTYAFNVKLAGEEVHGTSGSFRHFLWQVVRELQSSVLPILIPCPSGAAGVNKGKYLLAPGEMTYSEEKLLQFFGQLLGVAIRADMPISLDLLPSFWESLKKERLDLSDLREADCITYNLTQKMLDCSTPEEFDELLSGLVHGRGEEGEGSSSATNPTLEGLKFVFTGLDGVERELCEGGRERCVEFSSRSEFVRLIRDSRLQELACEAKMGVVRCGMASVVPLQLINILTAQDLDLRVCGLPDINLEYLKRHTMYQVGLMETDRHVQFFWNALESFSQDELRKFIKFACNQERIPFGHPCREGDSNMHVPPYPMKIAPPDGRGPPDSRYIRAETCMFMIKLPQYSSQETMIERLKYAIHCREDPLSG